jgi:hypothetical protein
MKSRHGQWLIVIKNIANIKPALTYAAATRHRPSPTDIEMNCHHGQWLTVIKNLAKIKPALTLAAGTRLQPPTTPAPRPPGGTLLRSNQPIPHPSLRDYMNRLSRIKLKLVPQVPHIHAQIVLVFNIRRPPNLA